MRSIKRDLPPAHFKKGLKIMLIFQHQNASLKTCLDAIHRREKLIILPRKRNFFALFNLFLTDEDIDDV